MKIENEDGIPRFWRKTKDKVRKTCKNRKISYRPIAKQLILNGTKVIYVVKIQFIENEGI